MHVDSYRLLLWKQFRRHPVGLVALMILILFFLIGLYAPLLASSQPLLVVWHGKWYSPLLRHLFYRGFFSKSIDIFYNLLMFTLPCGILLGYLWRSTWTLVGMAAVQIGLFCWLMTGVVKDPSSDPSYALARYQALEQHRTYRDDPLLAPITPYPGWGFELKYMTMYAQLELLLNYKMMREQHVKLTTYAHKFYEKFGREMPTLWTVAQRNERQKQETLTLQLQASLPHYEEAMAKIPDLLSRYTLFSHQYLISKLDQKEIEPQDPLAHEVRTQLLSARRVITDHRDALAASSFIKERAHWLEEETSHLKVVIPALLRPFHWENDAGGSQAMNQVLPWWERTRINRKDLVASLIFGIRVSIVVGITAVALSLALGIPLGAFAGYFAGKFDLLLCRWIEVWEAMPTFFMLLLIMTLTQSKSILLVIMILGLFGWTNFCRFIRAEVLKQRHLSYVYACKSLGYSHRKTLFSHILPNAIPPILTLIPFAIMAAISSEAGLSFLGLGEEGSTSWGVLMDEGRSVFPAESYLLWPAAILLTILLVCIALVGDVIRDALDPKLRSS